MIAFGDTVSRAIYLYRPEQAALPVLLVIEGSPKVGSPSWSPDGQRLAMTCRFEQRDEICIVRKDGTGLVRLGTSEEWNQVDPAWSPDGSTIAFVRTSVSAPLSRIVTIATDGTNAAVLADGFDPAWSREGTKLVFARDDGLFIMNRDGGAISRITTGKEYAPSWRPVTSR